MSARHRFIASMLLGVGDDGAGVPGREGAASIGAARLRDDRTALRTGA